MKILDLSHKIIITENRIKERTNELGRQITLEYGNRDLVVIGILKGSLLFFADLIRHIDLPILTDFLSVSSYEGNKKSSGSVTITNDITIPVKDRDLLIVEDIIDTGATSKFLIDHLTGKNPDSIKICALLNKQNSVNAVHDVKIDYYGFDVPDKFLIGYGLDYKEKYRNLPFIAEME
ncbi:MAG: hypoxanthine phosphoribosyltransferase [Desulfobacteraceae bacterium]|jgi:hypoxanthine phosphoribosyltransferase